MSDLIEIISLPFMQKALIAGALLGLILPFLGIFAILKKMAFFGDGVAHASLAGVALGVLTGFTPFGVALITGIFFGIVVYFLEKKTKLATDAILGMIFTTGMAVGVILLNFQKGYQPELISFLFGNVLALSVGDVIIILIFTVIIFSLLLAFNRQLALLVFDKETAWLSGVPIGWFELFLYIGLSLTVVLGVKLLGIVLISALLIIPPIIAKFLSHSFKGLIFFSVVVGEFIILSGLLLSYVFDLPSGATIILSGAGVFLIVFFSNQAYLVIRK